MTWVLCVALLLQTTPPPQAAPAASGPSQPAQAADAPKSPTQELDPDDLPVSIERIQRKLATPPAIRLDSGKPVFRVEVLGKNPTIEDILGKDFLSGPVSWGAITHQDFLNLVTPRDVQGYAAFSNKESLMVAATSVALQWALQKAIQKYTDSKKEREKEAARQEVLDALNALQQARAKAGLPPK
jgi:hypothetical protein